MTRDERIRVACERFAEGRPDEKAETVDQGIEAALDAALADVGGLDGLGGLDELAAQEAAAWAEVRMLGATGADAPRVALIGYVFPLRHGQIARLELPDSGLDPLDADRLIEFIQSLVIPERMDRP